MLHISYGKEVNSDSCTLPVTDIVANWLFEFENKMPWNWYCVGRGELLEQLGSGIFQETVYSEVSPKGSNENYFFMLCFCIQPLG